MEGPISKWTNMVKGWQYRYFVLDENSGVLSYYTSKEKAARGLGSRRGCVKLKDAVLGIDSENEANFTITTSDHKTFHFQGHDISDSETWIRALEKTVYLHSSRRNKLQSLIPKQLAGDVTGDSTLSIPEFERRITEADAYMQIMISQTEALDKKIANCTDEFSCLQLLDIKSAAEKVVESVKHAIVLLQIAKAQIAVRNGQKSTPIYMPTSAVNVPSTYDGSSPSTSSKVTPTHSIEKINTLTPTTKSSSTPNSITPNSNEKISSPSANNIITNTVSSLAATTLPDNDHDITKDEKHKNKSITEVSNEEKYATAKNIAIPESIQKESSIPVVSYSSDSDEWEDAEMGPEELEWIQTSSIGRSIIPDPAIVVATETEGVDGDDEVEEEELSSENEIDRFPDESEDVSTIVNGEVFEESGANISGASANGGDVSVPKTTAASPTDDRSIPAQPGITKERNANSSSSSVTEAATAGDTRVSANNNALKKAKSKRTRKASERRCSEIVSAKDYYDPLYDEIDVTNLDSLDSHGSIITHLLSQVRIGMDLTKIVLPTFILERRSLLEMYADFFAHPDLFVKVPDETTPKDRFIALVRWYLSAFHAGRKSPVAKKPYNPIIGETFRCYWDIPNYQDPKVKNPLSRELDKLCRCDPARKKDHVAGCPIPWASAENLVCVCEQVSHHPPISAFYAEHWDKRISVNGYIWTKSKFLGLSIGVDMVGEAVISLHDHNEDYLVTFPSAYGRSILTVPWVELGGNLKVSSPQTGYHGNIRFFCKPFYGGKKHQISCEMFAPNAKKPFCKVSGAWNGVMTAHWFEPNSDTPVRTDPKFVDTLTMPTVKKLVIPRSEQGPMESRRLWEKVTTKLKGKDVTGATEGKYFLEQRQREEAKQREAKNEKFNPRFFRDEGGGWVYRWPLIYREKLIHKERKDLGSLSASVDQHLI